MLQHEDTQRTLQSVASALPDYEAEQALVLTIVFHPDTALVGARATLVPGGVDAACTIGRHAPEFTTPAGDNCTLGDPHISRRALRLGRRGGAFELRRIESSSRCRVGAGELFECIELAGDCLERGVPLLLGHRVVLLLRRQALAPACVDCAPAMVGSSHPMAHLRAEVGAAAASDRDVLILGETGSGKELVAEAIHAASARRAGPLVSVNMAAIPPELAAAALFGNTRGAFTGADRASRGYFRDAAGGSLFLDEVGAASRQVQPQLLRALQQREIQPVGGALERVDLRILSATDAPLDDAEENFSAALRHRLGAMEINVPPLREHPEDIGELLLHFLAGSESCDSAAPWTGADVHCTAAWAEVFYRFLRCTWPGNVRQLANFSRRIRRSHGGRPALDAGLQAALEQGLDDARAKGAPEPVRGRAGDIPDTVFDAAMRRCAFEIKRVALDLGVSRATIYRRIESSPDYRLATEIPARAVRAALDDCGGSVADAALRLRVSHAALRNRLREKGPAASG